LEVKHQKNNKARIFIDGPCYVYGLVRTGIKIPYTILNIFFTKRKKIFHFFINIFIRVVDNAIHFLFFSDCIARQIPNKNDLLFILIV